MVFWESTAKDENTLWWLLLVTTIHSPIFYKYNHTMMSTAPTDSFTKFKKYP